MKLLFLNVSQLQFACFEKSFIGVSEIFMEQFFSDPSGSFKRLVHLERGISP